MSSSNRAGKYVIPDDLLAELDQIPLRSFRGAIKWTPETDAVILEGWEKRHQQKFIMWFKKKYGFGSGKTLRTRYNALNDQLLKKNHLSEDEYNLMFSEK